MNKTALSIALALSLTATLTSNADASTQKVMWGKTELKLGQIGKITILKDTQLYEIKNERTIVSVRTLKKGEEFRTYSYKNQNGGLYGVGSGNFIMKDTDVKYETPSKAKLLLLNKSLPVVKLPVKGDAKIVPKEIFKKVLGKSYDVVSYSNVTRAEVKGERLFYHSKDGDINIFSIDDSDKISEGYKLMKELGFTISEKEFIQLLSLSIKNEDAITIGDLYVFNVGDSIKVRW